MRLAHGAAQVGQQVHSAPQHADEHQVLRRGIPRVNLGCHLRDATLDPLARQQNTLHTWLLSRRLGTLSDNCTRREGKAGDGGCAPVTANENPAWLEVARAAAQRQAMAEARHLWGVRAGAEPPFNYRLAHITSVVGIALELAAATGAAHEVVLAAAWLHDVSKAFAEERGDGHGLRGAARARAILRRTDFPREKIDAVAHAISCHVGLFRDEPR